ncbi:MAG: PKD domain-containing protein, partial [Anaerolineales bacterium]
MKQKQLGLLRITMLVIILSLLVPPMPVLADGPFDSLDSDGDGIPDALELEGWYSLSGGPFYTDPSDADSDNDGLSDAEEKLFGTDPNDPFDPGLYMRYDPALQTRQYFSSIDEMEEDEWGNLIRKYLPVLQGGEQLLMTEALVVRRGATFRIGGPQYHGASLSISSSGLTTLTPVSTGDFDSSWEIAVPANAKTGTYTATMSLGGWSKNIPIYVIFEFPNDLTPDEIDAYIYDDDPDDLRDEVSVWWRTPEWSYYFPGFSDSTPPNCDDYPDSACSLWKYGLTEGYAQAFWTEQFTQKVFVNHAMAAIEGQTNRTTAANEIVKRADREFRTVYIYTNNNWSSAMQKFHDGTDWTMTGGACQDNANILTSLLRSAGFPAKTFAVDWNKTPGHGESGQFNNPYEYDHSVLVWLDGIWKGARSYNGEEAGDVYYPYYNGRKLVGPIYKWYFDSAGDLIVTSDHRWDWQDGSNGGGMVNTIWYGQGEGVPTEEFAYPNSNWDYHWWSHNPLEVERSPYAPILNYETWHGDNWAPSEWRDPPSSNPAGRVATQTYELPLDIPDPANPLENWPYNPVPTVCSPSSAGTPDCAAMLGGGGTQSALLSDALDAMENAAADAPTTPTSRVFLPLVAAYDGADAKGGAVQIGRVIRDYGIDTDDNGRYDELVAEFEVYVEQPGQYQIGGTLLVGDQAIRARADQPYLGGFYLDWGVQTVPVVFDGRPIGDAGLEGPYRVTELWVARAEQPIILAEPEELLAHHYLTYETNAYVPDAFEVVPALLAQDFSHRGLDEDGDGRYESLVVDAPLHINYPGDYRVTGDLYDGAGTFLGHASWSGDDAAAALQFDITKSTLPYTLEHLRLYAPNGEQLDSRHYKAYEIAELDGPVDRGAIALGNLRAASPGQFAPLDVTPTNIFTTTTVDHDGDGRYDQLVVEVGVEVTDAGGDYRIEGLLVDERGVPVAWSVSDPQTLGLGSQILELIFDGRLLHDHMPLSPATQSFTLVDVKIFAGNLSAATLEDHIAVALTTPAYTRDDFEPAHSSFAVFEDDMESGAGLWSWSSPWSLASDIGYSWSHAWRANSSGPDGALRVASPVDLSEYVSPALRFRTARAMQSAGDVGRLQVSTDGVSWSTLATYDDTTSHWTTQQVDLSAYSETPDVRFRFNAQAQSGLRWYVDDVFLNAWPAVTAAAFDYAPASVLIDEEVAFVADYTSIDTSLPMTYTWDFGDGSSIVATSEPTVTHTFTDSIDYTVHLIVENPYDDAAFSEVIPVYQPVTATGFDFEPETDASDWETQFTAVYTPASASQPVSYIWDFGDGGVSVTTNNATILHTFPATDTYTVLLTTTNGYGGEVTATHQVTVPFDNDGDGLTNATEDALGADPNDPDTDGDGLIDGEEVNTYGTDPNNPDSDDDGLTDYEEVNDYGTDPNDADSDDDGLIDGEEVNTHNTDPHDDDSDGDGMPDGWEVDNGLDPLDDSDAAADPDSDGLTNLEEYQAGTDPQDDDSDGDGMPDGWEIDNGLDPLVDDASENPDADALTNLEEYQAGTDPHDYNPSDISLDAASVAENQPAGTVVGAFSTEDLDDAAHIYSLVAGAGDDDNAAFDISGNELRTAASFDYETQHSYTIRVRTDDGQAIFEKSFTITITDVNDAPMFTSEPVTEATQDAPYSYTVAAADVDVGDALTITVESRPAWLTFVDHGDGTATLSGTPANDEVGDHLVELLATDAGGLTDTQTFTLTVLNVNDAPMFTSEPVTEATQDAAYSYTVAAADIDIGDALTITAEDLPAWLNLTDHGDGTATLSGTPANADVGDHAIT